MSLGGHLRTVTAHLRGLWAPPGLPPARPWTALAEDPDLGPIRLSGDLHAPDGAASLVLVVHGLGGCSGSGYVLRAARAALEAGWACLCLNLRGADRRGEDFYHAGLTTDLHAAVASPALAGFRRIAVLGYSLGGHVALRFATEERDPRVRAVAAVSSPLDLDRSARAIDRPGLLPYRLHLLGRLREIYGAVARRRPVPAPPEQLRRIRRIRDWDERTVAPRFGFAGAADYYARASVAPRLHRLALPSLLVAAEDDPLIPPAALRPALAGAPRALEVRWVPRGGHAGLPGGLDLGFPGPPGLEGQVLGWLGG